MGIKRSLSKVKDVSVKDCLSVFPMMAGLVLSPFYKKKYKNTWGICERKTEAKDNGYWLFEYITREHPEQKCIYAISRKCADYKKVKKMGEVIEFGSIKHWILYFTCKYLISSQSFKPNGYVCTFFERIGLFRPKHVFLQHGITKDIAHFLLASQMQVKYFIAGAEPEYEFMRDNFGHPDGTMQYTGFARFDALHDYKASSNRILIMPTWRKWLKLKSEAHSDAKRDFDSSDYLINWRKLLQSSELQELIKQYDLDIVFYPHPNMTDILNPHSVVGENIRIADTEKEDLQELMKSSKMLITDYSSVFFDMAYMKKPIVFFQFDEKTYRKYHYQQGWYDYHKTAFGDFCATSEEVLTSLKDILKRNFAVSGEFILEHNKVFTLYDKNNCKRIFEVLEKE